MLVLLVTLFVVAVPGLSAGFLAYRWLPLHPTNLATTPTAIEAGSGSPLAARTRFPGRLGALDAGGRAVVAIVVGGAWVGLVLVMIHTRTGFAWWDRDASLFAARHAAPLSTRTLQIFTQLGGAVVLVPLAAIVALVESIRQRSSAVVAFLVLTVGGQFLLANVIKAMVNRPRPDFLRLTGFSGPSFPSGHAVASSACLAAFALLVGTRRSLATRATLVGLAVGLATGIACCRVMLGVHWLTDVLAGLGLGWSWFVLCATALGTYRRRRGEKGSPEPSLSPSP